jgi:hypothetical protein
MFLAGFDGFWRLLAAFDGFYLAEGILWCEN